MCEINFLCAHKKLRSKRLAPVLIKEITRRVNLRGVFQACYTAGAALPTPVATSKYFHRSLNLRKLVDIKFMVLGHTMTISRAERLFRVPLVRALLFEHTCVTCVTCVPCSLSTHAFPFFCRTRHWRDCGS